MDDVIYKVLWIDDQPEIVQGYQLLAGLRNIQLIHYENWMDAQPTLNREFNELTAIILDANCKWDSSEQAPSERFLPDVLSKLQQMFGDRHREIPWYILSAGTMTNFDQITDTVNNRDRRAHEIDWGNTIYLKFKDEDKDSQKELNNLFDNIIKVGATQSNNLVLYRHRDTFQYLGNGKLLSDDARKILLKALAVLYYPEENPNYEFEGNPLRKVLEYLFRSANAMGLLPDEFFDKFGSPILRESMQYMCGMVAFHKNIRYGQEGETIFPTTLYNILSKVLEYTNEDSHTGQDNDEPYVIDLESKDLFFGYLFQILHVIKFYGQFVEQHPDVQANKKKAVAVGIATANQPTVESIMGTIGWALNKGRFYAIDCCKIDSSLMIKVGKKYRIDEVIENTGTDKVNFPFIATKVTAQE